MSFFLTGCSRYFRELSNWGSLLSLIRVTNPPPRIRRRFQTLGRPLPEFPTSAVQSLPPRYRPVTTVSAAVQCLSCQNCPAPAVVPSRANVGQVFLIPTGLGPVLLTSRYEDTRTGRFVSSNGSRVALIMTLPDAASVDNVRNRSVWAHTIQMSA